MMNITSDLPSREDWHNNYLAELIDMFNIVVNCVQTKFPNTQINISTAFHHFSRLMYASSSGVLSNYTSTSFIDDEDDY